MTDPRHLLLVGTRPGLGAATFDDLLTVSPEQLADAYAVDVIGGVLTAQLAVPAMRAAGGGTLLFTGGGFADALPATLATVSLGKVALGAAATMLARQLRDDVCNERPDAWREEYRFAGAQEPAASTS